MGFLKAIKLKKDEDDFLLFETSSKGKAFIRAYRSLRALLVA